MDNKESVVVNKNVFCSQCGGNNDSKNKFCIYCGNSLINKTQLVEKPNENRQSIKLASNDFFSVIIILLIFVTLVIGIIVANFLGMIIVGAIWIFYILIRNNKKVLFVLFCILLYVIFWLIVLGTCFVSLGII